MPTVGCRDFLAALMTLGSLAACSEPATTVHVSTYTDDHGRICTYVYSAEPPDESGKPTDRDAAAIDCDFPAEGTEPGTSSSHTLDLP